MKIQTKFLGEVEVQESRIIEFEKGLPAFEDEKQFIVESMGEDTPFFVLQSVNTVEVAFVVVNPFNFFKDYQVKLPDTLMDQLEIEKEEDVAIFSILTLKEPFANTTINLQAPVVINAKTQKGKQFVLIEGDYSPRTPLMPEAATKEEEVR